MDSVLAGQSLWQGTEPQDPADHKREHPAGCAGAMRICPQAGQRGATKGFLPVSFFLNWNRAIPSPLFQLLGAGEGAAARQREPSCLKDENGSLPRLPFFCLGDRSGLGPHFPSFLGIFCTKTGVGGKSAYSMLAFAMPESPAWSWGRPPGQLSLLGTGQRRAMRLGPSSAHISGECFHLPNPSPRICPQRGTKGLLTAQI